MPRVRATFYLRPEYGLFPSLVEAWVATRALELSTFRGVKNIKVELYDLNFRCQVVGYREKTSVLFLPGAPFFRGVARALSERSSATNSCRRRPNAVLNKVV